MLLLGLLAPRGRSRIVGLVATVKRWLGLQDIYDLAIQMKSADEKTRLRAVTGFAALASRDKRAQKALFDAFWDQSRDVRVLAMERLFTVLSPDMYDDFVALEQVDADNRFDHMRQRYVQVIRERVFDGTALSED